MIDVNSEAFAARLGNMLRARRRETRMVVRRIAHASGGRFTTAQLRAAEAGTLPLVGVDVGSIAALYGANLQEILPDRLPLSIDLDTGTIATGGVRGTFMPGDERSLLLSYLHLVRDLRNQQQEPTVVLRRHDIEVLGEQLLVDGAVVIERLGEIMGSTVTQRRASVALFLAGATLVVLATGAVAVGNTSGTGDDGARAASRVAATDLQITATADDETFADAVGGSAGAGAGAVVTGGSEDRGEGLGASEADTGGDADDSDAGDADGDHGSTDEVGGDPSDADDGLDDDADGDPGEGDQGTGDADRDGTSNDAGGDDASDTDDGPDEDGPDEDGPDEDGPDEDGPDEDGPDEDGPDEDGPDEDGPDGDDTDLDGPDEDGPDEDDDSADEGGTDGEDGAGRDEGAGTDDPDDEPGDPGDGGAGYTGGWMALPGTTGVTVGDGGAISFDRGGTKAAVMDTPAASSATLELSGVSVDGGNNSWGVLVYGSVSGTGGASGYLLQFERTGNRTDLVVRHVEDGVQHGSALSSVPVTLLESSDIRVTTGGGAIRMWVDGSEVLHVSDLVAAGLAAGSPYTASVEGVFGLTAQPGRQLAVTASSVT